MQFIHKIYLLGYNLIVSLDNIPLRVYTGSMNPSNPIAVFIRKNRQAAGLTQEEFARRAGLGLRFVRDLEQGKESLRLDKVNQALSMFGAEASPQQREQNHD